MYQHTNKSQFYVEEQRAKKCLRNNDLKEKKEQKLVFG